MFAVARYSLVDLFAGCGGMTLGFTMTERFEPILAVEFEPDAADTYELNFGAHVARDADGRPAAIEDVPAFPDADVVDRRPAVPGLLAAEHARRRPRTARPLARVPARARRGRTRSVFVMENVPELLRSAEYADFKAAAEDELGFRVEGRILNAADYGVPQTRRRAIVIGTRLGDDPVARAAPTGRRARSRRAASEWRTFRDAVEGLPLDADRSATGTTRATRSR